MKFVAFPHRQYEATGSFDIEVVEYGFQLCQEDLANQRENTIDPHIFHVRR
jgi:hypothetical protein